MDELMMYNYLKSRGMEGMDEHEFMDKFKTFMTKYRRNSMRNMEEDDYYPMDRHSDSHIRRNRKSNDFMNMFDSDRNERFSSRFNNNDTYNSMKYMRDSMNDNEHFTESEAKYIVADMYHMENGRKYTGERFDMHKAKEICERYRGILPNSTTPADVYVAINSQYHDYAELFKNWFGNDVEQKVIESAIVFWFKDIDAKSENKLIEYFKEY